MPSTAWACGSRCERRKPRPGDFVLLFADESEALTLARASAERGAEPRNAESHRHLASGLPANPENRYYPRQLGVHPGNPGSMLRFISFGVRRPCIAMIPELNLR